MLLRDAASDDFETLPQILARVWRGKSYVLAGLGVGIVVAVLLTFLLKPHYEASMIVAPPAHDSRTDSFVEGVFVYAPEVEAKIPTGSPDFIRFEQSLRGAAVAGLLLKMDGIADAIAEDTVFHGIGSAVNTPEDLMLYLQRHVIIETVGATASRKISYRHPDPHFAVKFLTRLRKTNDQIIRTSVRAEVETKIDWLKEEFRKTLNPDHRKALAQLLMTEERRRMLLSLETPYAVSVVEEASALPHPVIPNVPMLFVMMGLAGIFLGALLSLIKSARVL